MTNLSVVPDSLPRLDDDEPSGPSSESLVAAARARGVEPRAYHFTQAERDAIARDGWRSMWYPGEERAKIARDGYLDPRS